MKRRPSSLPITCNTSHTFIGFSLLKPVWVFRMSRFVLCTRSHFSEARPPPPCASRELSEISKQNPDGSTARAARSFYPTGAREGGLRGITSLCYPALFFPSAPSFAPLKCCTNRKSFHPTVYFDPNGW